VFNIENNRLKLK